MNEFRQISLFVAALIVPHADCLAQVSNVKRGLLDVTVISAIKQPGTIVDAISWFDIQGSNLLVLSESITPGKRDTVSRNASLYAAHYLAMNGDWVRQWKVEDYENNCPVDVGARFIPESVQITDLDANGYAEVSFMYRVFCAGGIDPQTLKLVMYEKKKKYVIRGETLVKLPEQPAYGGETRIDASMKMAPYEFQNFSLKQWNRFRAYP